MPFFRTAPTALDLPVENTCALSRAHPPALHLPPGLSSVPRLLSVHHRGAGSAEAPLGRDASALCRPACGPRRADGEGVGTDTFSLLGANTASIVKMNNLLHRDCLLTALSLFTFQLSNTLDGEPACQPFRRSPRAQPPGFSPQETVSISSARSGSNYSCSVMTLSILS